MSILFSVANHFSNWVRRRAFMGILVCNHLTFLIWASGLGGNRINDGTNRTTHLYPYFVYSNSRLNRSSK